MRDIWTVPNGLPDYGLGFVIFFIFGWAYFFFEQACINLYQYLFLCLLSDIGLFVYLFVCCLSRCCYYYYRDPINYYLQGLGTVLLLRQAWNSWESNQERIGTMHMIWLKCRSIHHITLHVRWTCKLVAYLRARSLVR